jgi:hypothetical protein
MDFHRIGDTLVMSGPVTGNELVQLRNFLAQGEVKLVLLHESPGGDLWNGYQVGNRIRSEGLPTAVSGKCESACGLIFLGGTERSFSDGRPIAVTMVGLHGAHTTDTKQPISELAPRMAYVIRTLTGDKYPPEPSEPLPPGRHAQGRDRVPEAAGHLLQVLHARRPRRPRDRRDHAARGAGAARGRQAAAADTAAGAGEQLR